MGSGYHREIEISSVKSQNTLFPHSHIFVGDWLVAGEADWRSHGLGTNHQGSLCNDGRMSLSVSLLTRYPVDLLKELLILWRLTWDDHLPGLEVPGGHQVAAQRGGAAHLEYDFGVMTISTENRVVYWPCKHSIVTCGASSAASDTLWSSRRWCDNLTSQDHCSLLVVFQKFFKECQKMNEHQ